MSMSTREWFDSCWNGQGSFLLTAGYDAKINLWNARDFSLLKTLEGHEGKIMDIDISKDEKRLLSCSYDKTWKIWQAS